MIFLYLYLVFGAGLYTGAWLVNPLAFREVDWTSILRGIIGAVLWPVTIYLLLN